MEANEELSLPSLRLAAPQRIGVAVRNERNSASLLLAEFCPFCIAG